MFYFPVKRALKIVQTAHCSRWSICIGTSAAVDPSGRTTLVRQNQLSILLWQCSTFLLKEDSKLTFNLQMHFSSC